MHWHPTALRGLFSPLNQPIQLLFDEKLHLQPCAPPQLARQVAKAQPKGGAQQAGSRPARSAGGLSGGSGGMGQKAAMLNQIKAYAMLKPDDARCV